MTPEIRHIYVSPGHNYVGHHGQEPGTHPMTEVAEVECVAGKGLQGDRYFDHKEDFKGQITFFDWTVYEELVNHFQRTDLSPSAMRRNVLIDGLDLDRLIGATFEIQGIQFSGSQESAPCYWMNRAVAEGAEEFMRGRGGLRARILTDGVLQAGPSPFRVLD